MDCDILIFKLVYTRCNKKLGSVKYLEKYILDRKENKHVFNILTNISNASKDNELSSQRIEEHRARFILACYDSFILVLILSANINLKILLDF